MCVMEVQEIYQVDELMEEMLLLAVRTFFGIWAIACCRGMELIKV